MKKRQTSIYNFDDGLFDDELSEEEVESLLSKLPQERDVDIQGIPATLTKPRLKEIQEQLENEKNKQRELETKTKQSSVVLESIEKTSIETEQMKNSLMKAVSGINSKDILSSRGSGIGIDNQAETFFKALEKNISECFSMLRHYFRQNKKFIPNKVIIIPDKFANKDQEAGLPWSLLNAAGQENKLVAENLAKFERNQVTLKDFRAKLLSHVREGLKTRAQTISKAVDGVEEEVANVLKTQLKENEKGIKEKSQEVRKSRNRLRVFYKKEYSVLLISLICLNIIDFEKGKKETQESMRNLKSHSKSMGQSLEFVHKFNEQLVNIEEKEKHVLMKFKTQFLDFFYKVNEKFFKVGNQTKLSKESFASKEAFFLLTKQEKDVLQMLQVDGSQIAQSIRNALACFEFDLREFNELTSKNGFLIEALDLGMQEPFRKLMAIETIYKKTIRLFGEPRLFKTLEQMKILQKKLLFYGQGNSKEALKALGLREHEVLNAVGDLEEYVEYLKSKSTSIFLVPVINFFNGFVVTFRKIQEDEG